MMLFMNSTTANSPAPPADADVLEPDDPRRHFAAAVTTVADALTAVRPDQYESIPFLRELRTRLGD